MLTVKIIPNDKGNPPGKLADVELHFAGTAAGPFDGLKLIGFAIWERRAGSGRNVTFPARQYSVNGERRSFALLRPIADTAAQNHVRDLILRAYMDFEHIAEAEPIGPPTDFARQLSDAIKAAPPVAEAPFSLTSAAATADTVQPSLIP
jgi:hypothetical protein